MTNQTPDMFHQLAHGGYIAAKQSIEHCDPKLVGDDRQRAKTDCLKILARLRQGPATTGELAQLALNYTGRISDLRKSGYRIECFERRKGGNNRYRLVDQAGTPNDGSQG